MLSVSTEFKWKLTNGQWISVTAEGSFHDGKVWPLLVGLSFKSMLGHELMSSMRSAELEMVNIEAHALLLLILAGSADSDVAKNATTVDSGAI